MPEHQWRGRATLAAAAAGALVAASACSPGSTSGAGSGELAGVELLVAAKWTGVEQDNFTEVLAAFEEETGATVNYESTGEDTGAYLGPKIEAEEPPDIAILPQPGLVAEYAEQEALVPLSGDAATALEENYTDYWRELGSVDGEPYGVLLKAAHKSIVWYRPDAFDEAGVSAPETWADLTGETASTLSDAGVTPFSMCGASGWTLTDWFENVYLSQHGPEAYDQLIAREIPWDDDTVVETLETLAEVWGEEDWLAGGTDGAVQTDFPTCVTEVYGQENAAMVYEADFVAASAQEAGATVGEDAQAFPFPAVGEEPPVVVGGDIAVAMTEKEGVQQLMAYLASPEAQTTWAGLGGYLSANSEVQPDAYPDEFTQTLAQTILEAGDNVRYDLSDQVPSQFGATEGKGMWAVLQDFLRDPSDPEAAAADLEEAAASAE
ncbi:ABC transporter substrate-binding protein [Streptomonospora nanhaiensis]|uniref:Alpha-glucoside transport system substrate-binding protein n=1 Tax=Streptomonospora nanhaiensis TaxID=1323731 RepID=A0A853BGU2_9ACTN|nr:extracellular solute-binding protein [Streptomonospora nanhaiensis]MBV2365009.1 extracellular solute-binding protein [Streptomonospora nanhaiensis]MBX9389090.1 extracellular solute-binding protein [Streptomonospora nanhaiensis]NYI94533.1 alpha-glucoside transport system substrate-binding protein [Streptomonospora nanhaiensis]